MPRDGSGNYSAPIGTTAVTDTTIESSKYNNFIADLVQDLNLPRPIVAGGTGASSASAALQNLGGEQAKQVITDFTNNTFVAGSFYAAAAAANSPVAGHSFSGICYVTDTNNMFVEARDQDDTVRPGRIYVRQMKAGVWSGWAQDINSGNASSAAYWWQFSAATTFPPVVGQIRLNNATQNLATHLYISHQTTGGADMTSLLPALIQPGGKIYIQDNATPANYISFNVVSAVYTVGDADVTVTFNDMGSPLAPFAVNALTFLSPAGANMFVRYDAPTALSVAQQVQARQNIAAAPFDALAFNGMNWNGNMLVDQSREGGASSGWTGGAGAGWSIDGWFFRMQNTVTANCTLQLIGDAPLGYEFSQKLTVQTAQAAMGVNDFVEFEHLIEGYRTQRLYWGVASALPMTIGFYVKAHRPGQYSGSIRNQPWTRAYAFPFTINAADTWEFKTVTIPGDTAAGFWNNIQNGCNMYVTFVVACGTGMMGSAGSWNNSGVPGALGQINGVAATTDTFQIAGVIMLPGIELPTVDRMPFIQRTFQDELQIAMRYLEKSYDVGTPDRTVTNNGVAWNYINYTVAAGYNFGQTVPFKVTKRAVPSINARSPDSGAPGYARDRVAATDIIPSFNFISQKSFSWSGVVSGSPAVVNVTMQWIADARLS